LFGRRSVAVNGNNGVGNGTVLGRFVADVLGRLWVGRQGVVGDWEGDAELLTGMGPVQGVAHELVLLLWSSLFFL
jgi:hypothetical protein